MAQRFIELTDAETNRAVWIDPECIAVLRVVMREKEPCSDVTAVTYKVGTMREVAVVKEMPGKILELAADQHEPKPPWPRTIAIVGGHEAAQEWLRENATLVGQHWIRNLDGARCVPGNHRNRFIGLALNEVLTLADADRDAVEWAMRRKVYA